MRTLYNLIRMHLTAFPGRNLRTLFPAVLILAFLGVPEVMQATHLIGGTLSYRCLGNNMYEISLIYRRDCNLGAPGTEFEPAAIVRIFDLTTNIPLNVAPGGASTIQMAHIPIDTANQTFINDCTLAGDDLCIEQTVYRDTIQLSFRATGYRFVYQRCCRNSSLNNVFDPLNTGMTLSATLSGFAQQNCNSSPQLGDYPPIYICVDQPFVYQFPATDPDGDSLVYELYTPYLGASDGEAQPALPVWPIDTIKWLDPPYSLANLLGGVPLTIDRQTGIMTATPNLIGQFLVGVRVYSYRNGQLIEITTREWQFNVRPCQVPPTPIIDAEGLLNCNGLSVHITESSLSAYTLEWILDYPDGFRSTDSIIDYTYDEPGFYTVALIVSSMDSVCIDTAFAQVGVFFSEVEANFALDIPKCDDPIIIQAEDMSDDPDPEYDIASWQYILTYPGAQPDTQTNPLALYSLDSAAQNVNLSLTVTSSNGCTATYDTTFDVNLLYLPFPGDTVGICEGDSVPLFLVPGPTGPGITYIWDPTTGLDLTLPNYPIAFADTSQMYYVTITDGLCEISDSVKLQFTPIPVIDFEAITDCRSLTVDFQNNSTNGFNYLWDFGDGQLALVDDTVYTYQNPGIYTVILYSADVACNVFQEKTVIVNAISDDIDQEGVSCFAQPTELNPNGDPSYMYLWSPAQFLDSDTAVSPIATIEQTTTFYVTITDSLGCVVVDSISLVFGEDFDFDVPGDSAYCEAPAILLSVGNGSPDVNYQWFDLDSNLLGTGPEFLTAPDTQTSYIIIGTDTLGCQKMDTVTLSPTFFYLDVGGDGDTVLCFGDSATLFVNNLDTSQHLEYVWSPANQISGSNIGPTVIAKPEFGDVTYYVEVTNPDVGCVTTDSVRVRVSLFQIEYAPSVQICLGEMIELNMENNDTTDLQFSWTPVGSIKPGTENTSSPIVMPTETTVYTAHVVDNYGCAGDFEITVNVSWFDPDFLEIFTDNDTVVLNDKDIHVFTNQDPSNEFMWSGMDIQPPGNTPEITITPTIEGTFSIGVTVTNEDGCELIGEIAITVLDPDCNEETVFLPDAFSPNGDGQNDELQIYGNFIESLELHIFNRWGEEVYKTNDVNFSWDGRYKGKELDPDVFGFYMRVVCTPDKPFFRKGNITLLR